ncbi:MAG: DEAD/DEAH box helicase family protein [Acidobacteriota bacterium]|nr:DEAD/DEAH box helicase family protein [Acidobacteriota bacterium]
MERRIAARRNRLALAGVEVDRRLVDREYQIACIEALFAEVSHGRRKLLVEMATGTGKTRTAAAFVKRLFEAGIVTRVLFLVDRIALAGQAEDAFNDHLRDYPCHRAPAGPRLRPHEADHHRDVADDDPGVPGPIVGLLRSRDHRRMPSGPSTVSGAACSGTSTASSSA